MFSSAKMSTQPSGHLSGFLHEYPCIPSNAHSLTNHRSPNNPVLPHTHIYLVYSHWILVPAMSRSTVTSETVSSEMCYSTWVRALHVERGWRCAMRPVSPKYTDTSKMPPQCSWNLVPITVSAALSLGMGPGRTPQSFSGHNCMHFQEVLTLLPDTTLSSPSSLKETPWRASDWKLSAHESQWKAPHSKEASLSNLHPQPFSASFHYRCTLKHSLQNTEAPKHNSWLKSKVISQPSV